MRDELPNPAKEGQNPALQGALSADEISAIKKWVKEFVPTMQPDPASAGKAPGSITVKLEVDASELIARLDSMAQRLATLEKLQRRSMESDWLEGQRISLRL